MRAKTAGFTLLELLVVIAIIGLLSAVVFGSLSNAKDNAKEVVALKEIRTLNEAMFFYELDTGRKFECFNMSECTNNLLSPSGVVGWDGPYIKDTTHAWGGQILITRKFNLQNSTSTARETLIYLNTGMGNRFPIPDNSMREIDRDLDDGVYNTGSVIYAPSGINRTFVPGGFNAGEMLIRPEI